MRKQSNRVKERWGHKRPDALRYSTRKRSPGDFTGGSFDRTNSTFQRLASYNTVSRGNIYRTRVTRKQSHEPSETPARDNRNHLVNSSARHLHDIHHTSFHESNTNLGNHVLTESNIYFGLEESRPSHTLRARIVAQLFIL